MPTIEVSVCIAAPAAAIEAVLLDAELAPRWTSGLERLELVDGCTGAAGSVGHAHYREGGRYYVLTDVLEEVEPGRRYLSRVTGGGIAVRVETILEPVSDDDTQMTLRWSGRGTNPVTFMVLPFMRGRIRERALADLESLKSLIETPT
jgi:hypothetical protein